MKQFTSEKQKIGEIGENIACRFLIKQGFKVLERNYTKKWGEIDIVTEKGKKIHFIEVKTVSRENLDTVIHETLSGEYSSYRPEDNMHPWKLKRLGRTIQTYLLDKNIPDEKDWQLDLAVVFLNLKEKKAKVKILENIIL